MNYELLLITALCLAVVAYGLKRYFDDRAESRKLDSVKLNEILVRLPEMQAVLVDMPVRLNKYEKALAEAINQVFEFARATKESELKKTAQAAGVIAKVSSRGGMPKP